MTASAEVWSLEGGGVGGLPGQHDLGDRGGARRGRPGATAGRWLRSTTGCPGSRRRRPRPGCRRSRWTRRGRAVLGRAGWSPRWRRSSWRRRWHRGRALPRRSSRWLGVDARERGTEDSCAPPGGVGERNGHGRALSDRVAQQLTAVNPQTAPVRRHVRRPVRRRSGAGGAQRARRRAGPRCGPALGSAAVSSPAGTPRRSSA